MNNQSNTPAISPLRHRLIDDMNLRHFVHEIRSIPVRASASPPFFTPGVPR